MSGLLFNVAYQLMLKGGMVNKILDIEWVVTDLKFDGVPDFIHRGGDVTADLAWNQEPYWL